MKILKKLSLVLLFCSTTNLIAQDNMDALMNNAMQVAAGTVISVSIGGDFFINGTFSVLRTERFDQFLTRIVYQSGGANNNNGSVGSTVNLDMIPLMKTSIKRNIKILRTNGEQLVIDLDKFYLTGDLSQNPYLRQDDVIIFSKINLETTYIVVDGAVNKRLKFPFVEGDKLSDAILFANGIDPSYENTKYAKITRISYDGRSSIIDTVSLDIMNEYSLKNGDIVTVLGDVLGRKDFKVLVVGEVNNPGFVYVTKNNTQLKDVIKKAGGFKDNAWLEYSELVRGTTPDKKVQQEAIVSAYETNGIIDNTVIESLKPRWDLERWKMFRTANLYEDHNQIFQLDADLSIAQSNRLVDFSRLADPNADENNFIVEDGDVIFIPKRMDLVYVMGQIANPGQYEFKKEYTYRDYLARAGGLSEAADSESEVYIIKGKSYNWVKVDDLVSIEPGDHIWVRKDPERSFNFYLQRVSAVTGIVGSIATIVLLITQLVK